MSANKVYDPNDPVQALEVITQCADSVQGNWATHQVIRQSIATLSGLIDRVASLEANLKTQAEVIEILQGQVAALTPNPPEESTESVTA